MVLPVYQDFPLTLAPQEDLYYPVGQKIKKISQANDLLFHFKIKIKIRKAIRSKQNQPVLIFNFCFIFHVLSTLTKPFYLIFRKSDFSSFTSCMLTNPR